jgi:transcriptional antiterminator NusG
VADHLGYRGYRHYLPAYPAYSSEEENAGRPVFPGYIFCRYERNIQAPLITIPGVIRILGAGNAPTPVDETELNSLRSVLGSGRWVYPSDFLETGVRVVMAVGPLRGVEGIVKSARNGHRLVVSVSLLQRSVEVEIDARWLRRA